MTQTYVGAGEHAWDIGAADREPGAVLAGPPLLVIGDVADDIVDSAAVAAGFRVQRRIATASAATGLDDLAQVAVLWVADAARIDREADARIAAFVAEQRAGLVLVTHRADIDRVSALDCAVLASDILVDPAPADAAIAMTRALRPFRVAVHDSDEQAPTIDRLDRLQDEVTRIAAVLARLSLDDANRVAGAGDYIGYAAPTSAFGADGGWSDSVASATRGYGAAGMPGAFPSGLSNEEMRVRQVRTIIRLRRARDVVFPTDLFADPAWDMLLDLYAARLEGKAVSVSSLCIAAAVPATTALRWIRSMTDAGLFLREADGNDRRRVFIALADRAADAMDRYFTSIGDALPV